MRSVTSTVALPFAAGVSGGALGEGRSASGPLLAGISAALARPGSGASRFGSASFRASAGCPPPCTGDGRSSRLPRFARLDPFPWPVAGGVLVEALLALSVILQRHSGLDDIAPSPSVPGPNPVLRQRLALMALKVGRLRFRPSAFGGALLSLDPLRPDSLGALRL